MSNNDKKTIFYFRTKSLERGKNNNNSIYLFFSYDNYDDSTINEDQFEKDEETGLFKQRCYFDQECLLDRYYVSYLKVMLQDDSKDLIEWEFYHINNHRILINFNN
jgi:hypothetical protein